MNTEEFILTIKKVVEDTTISNLLEELDETTLPSEKLKRMSLLYNKLSLEDREVLKEIITESAQSALFGFFCVLDGVRAIEDGPDKGRLELWYKNDNDGQAHILNNQDVEFMHDIYNS
ncbi:hypothetical protein GO495_31465 [Chitinophaga oryziterrae]|uniref:Uncharacterized protein n=1 Tax=Chitinophaga oryziterrae TaxID=1031224 RepID=A0A6N8JL59_9BACT|nr:hypothetical protein [Chitinophaga oryziterrae]MVT45149.1 hypothetical protein [Chitinophaga oryziterrae]